MTTKEMLREFHTVMSLPLDIDLWEDPPQEKLAWGLIEEEFNEAKFFTSEENFYKELCDLVYVIYGYCARSGFDLDEGIKRVHKANMSKINPVTGEVDRREDGKVLKGPNYKPADLYDLI